jgi:DNA-binding response OmpR family regulator
MGKKYLHVLKNKAKIPVVMISGRPGYHCKYHETGAFDYISKPPDLNRL